MDNPVDIFVCDGGKIIVMWVPGEDGGQIVKYKMNPAELPKTKIIIDPAKIANTSIQLPETEKKKTEPKIQKGGIKKRTKKKRTKKKRTKEKGTKKKRTKKGANKTRRKKEKCK